MAALCNGSAAHVNRCSSILFSFALLTLRRIYHFDERIHSTEIDSRTLLFLIYCIITNSGNHPEHDRMIKSTSIDRFITLTCVFD